MFFPSRSIALAVLVCSLAALQPAEPMASRTGPAAPDHCVAFLFAWWDGRYYADVRWTDNSDDEDGFILECKGPHESTFLTLGPDLTTAYALPSGPNFHYRVRAFNASGMSAWSKWSRFLTGGNS